MKIELNYNDSKMCLLGSILEIKENNSINRYRLFKQKDIECLTGILKTLNSLSNKEYTLKIGRYFNTMYLYINKNTVLEFMALELKNL
nr:MAG TPA: hypothetical protein [Ackermannviridae sp.]